jgi:N-acetylglutamate synthase-like GNAT family acetyltransferase
VKIISIRENPEYKSRAISYFQQKWKSVWPIIYEDCINHCSGASSPLPQWYLLVNEDELIGCAGLITNDFISRMDLYPWVCAIYIEEKHRGHNYGASLVDKAKADTKSAGFARLYLSTDHIGYYEKMGFEYMGQGYHPWGEESRIYQCKV